MTASATDSDIRESLYSMMTLIRQYEERVFELFDEGELFGTTHGYIGQEAIAASVLSHLRPDDIVVSGHRCHGHYLAKTGDVVGILAEQMGRSGGISGGRGGSQQLCSSNFYSIGVLGSTAPLALGMAMAEQRKESGSIVVLFIGDGAFGEGVVYEAMNMAALWSVPLLFVVENNYYAQSTPIELNTSGSLVGRAEAFGIDAGEIKTNDAEVLHSRFADIVGKVRTTGVPHFEVVNTYRLNAHSKGDDDRPADEVDSWRLNDPITILGDRLPPSRRQELDDAARDQISAAEQTAKSMPYQNLNIKNPTSSLA